MMPLITRRSSTGGTPPERGNWAGRLRNLGGRQLKGRGHWRNLRHIRHHKPQRRSERLTGPALRA